MYGDTDSSYFLTYADNKEDAIRTTDIIAKKVNSTFQGFITKTFLCTEGFNHLIQTSKDIISDRSIFCDKKRYILHIVEKEGHPPSEKESMKTMGVEIKKTALPKEISKKLNSFIKRLLMSEEWDDISVDIVALKEALMEINDIMLIGLPKGIKKSMKKYKKEYEDKGSRARLPGTIAAAIHYNECLGRFKDPGYKIVAGTKVKLFYLTQKYGRFKSIAIPTDIETVPGWFLEHYKVDRAAHIERLVDKPINNILKAIDKVAPSKQDLVVHGFLEF